MNIDSDTAKSGWAEMSAGDRESSLDRLEIFYRNYLNTPMAICFTDTHGNIIEANDAFLKLYGYEIDEIRGNNPRVLKSGRQSPAVYKELWESISNREIGSWTGELINRKKNGDEIYVLLTISSVFRPDGSLIGYIASTLNITDRKKMEIELEERNAELERMSRFKSDMMAITSHDLKAPLNAMISYADLIQENMGSLPEIKTREYLSKISQYGRQLTEFISELLDLTKIESGKFQLMTSRVRIDAVLQGCIDIGRAHGAGKGIKINFYREGKSRTAVADVLRLTQVFNNVLSNAVKFSPDGKEITVKYIDDGSGVLTITIEDQGIGIPEEDLPMIFNQYYQVQKQGHLAKRAFGAGIGLSVVKNIIELHGGSVIAENLPDRTGCRFTITMPLKTVSSVKDLGIMIFDPRESIFGYIEPVVRASGCDSYTVKTKEEAKRVFNHECPDAVFVECNAAAGEIRAFLEDLKKADGSLIIIGISDCEPPHDGLYFSTLSTPVIDLEINDILKEMISFKRKKTVK